MILILTLILCFIPNLAQGQFGDVRCKCVCPASSPNSTNIKRVFSKSFHDSRDCKCEGVVDKEAQEGRPHLCDRCDCQWQRRNTMTIKFVVIFIICVVSILVLYMGFLICLDPLLPRRDVPYVEHKNEEARNFPKRGSVDQNQDSPSIQGPSNGVLWRMKNKVFGMRSQQERWKDTVQEQRRHIYDHHTMLN